MKAIITTYAADEHHRPVIDAECAGKKSRIAYDSTISLDDNHVLAAQRLAIALGWCREWAYGILPLGRYCHVAVTGLRAYSTTPPPGASSPPETWRGRPSLSTARRLAGGR